MLLALFHLDLDHVMAWIGAGGYYALFGLLFACGLGLPLPEDIPLTVAGIFVGSHHMHLGVAAIVAWCGIIGGDCVLYNLGKRYGLNITKIPLIGHHVTEARIKRAEVLFQRYGVWVVGVGRMFAGIRGAMVVAAGAIRFNFLKFIIADGLAAIVSGGIFLCLGIWLGHNLTALEKRVEEFKWGLAILAGVGVFIWIGYILWRRKSHKTPVQAVIDKVIAPVYPSEPRNS